MISCRGQRRAQENSGPDALTSYVMVAAEYPRDDSGGSSDPAPLSTAADKWDRPGGEWPAFAWRMSTKAAKHGHLDPLRRPPLRSAPAIVEAGRQPRVDGDWPGRWCLLATLTLSVGRIGGQVRPWTGPYLALPMVLPGRDGDRRRPASCSLSAALMVRFGRNGGVCRPASCSLSAALMVRSGRNGGVCRPASCSLSAALMARFGRHCDPRRPLRCPLSATAVPLVGHCGAPCRPLRCSLSATAVPFVGHRHAQNRPCSCPRSATAQCTIGREGGRVLGWRPKLGSRNISSLDRGWPMRWSQEW